MNIKKLFSRSLILVMLFTFALTTSSCSLFGGDQDITFSDEAKQEKRAGTLKSLGGMSVGQGTHILEMKDGEALRLRSTNIDLDLVKYINKNVEVRGLIGKASDEKNIMEVVSIDITEDEEEEAKIKGNPKDYKNADLGFELTYLDTWLVEENNNEIVFEAPQASVEVEVDEMEEEDITASIEEFDPDTIIIKRLPNPDKETIEEYMELPDDADELATLGYSRTLTGVDKIEGLKNESSDKLEIDIWLTRGEYVYRLSFVGSDTADTINNRNIYYSMNSSFKFIGFAPDEEEDVEDEDVELPPVEDPIYDDIDTDVVEEEPVEEPVVEPVVEPEPEEEPVADSSSYGVVAQYISSSINSIAPEDSEAGSWSANDFEFVDPNYVYVDYSDGSASRRVLLTYNQDGGLTTDVVGYFEPGDTTSWERVEGENPVASAEKTVVTLTDEGAQETTTVKEGYRYFESLPYDFTAQYPSNWYFNGTSGSGDVNHHYGFSNEPVEDGNELVSVDIVSAGASGTAISVGSHSGTKVYSGGEVAIYIERDDGLYYKVHGGTEYEQQIIDIAASIHLQ